MKYFLDTEFHEYKKKPFFSKPVDTIELISIGIVSEDDREYYAISKDFDLKEAWKNDWLRENVLKKLHSEMCKLVSPYGKTHHYSLFEDFTIKSMKTLIRWYGKTNKQIAEEIKSFTKVDDKSIYEWAGFKYFFSLEDMAEAFGNENKNEFYGYYSDYDWVRFCWLFGRMIDLPKGFPMYCKDLKQIFDDKVWNHAKGVSNALIEGIYPIPSDEVSTHKIFNELLEEYKLSKEYPKQTNEHNALQDALFNKELYEFLNKI